MATLYIGCAIYFPIWNVDSSVGNEANYYVAVEILTALTIKIKNE
jgi:hypothetical protein